MIAAILGTAAVVGLLAAAVLRWRHKTPVPAAGTAARRRQEAEALALGCRHCDGEPWKPCTCTGDCGRRYCDWATLIGDREFSRELAAMLNEGDHQ